MFKKYQLKNGMNVLFVESHKSPVLSIQMWVRTGSADEKKGEEGISHFIEHLVFKGTRNYQLGEIASSVEAAGGELNAYTSFDQTVFYVTISKEFQSIGLDVIAEMMGFPQFDKSEIDNEREVVIEEIKRSNDSPHRQASRLLFSSVYKKHPYGIPVIGYDSNIKTVSRETLLRYFHDRYNPRNMTLVVAGDFRAAEMKPQVQKLFGGFPVNKLRVVKRPAVTAPKKSQVVVEKAPFNETIIHWAFPIPKATHKDIAALEVFALILGQGDSSRLNQRLRLKEHLVNFAGSSVFVAKDPGFFAISASINEKDLDATLKSLTDELILALQQAPSAAELIKAQTNLASEQFYNMETVDGLARNFGHYQDLFGDPSYFQKFIKQVQGLKASDVLKVARKYLSGSGDTLVMMTSAEAATAKKVVEHHLKVFRARRSKAIRSKGQNLKGVKSKPLVLVAKAPAKVKGDVEKWVLSNGVTVITRPNFDTPVVSLRCASLGGSRLETDRTQGAVELLSRVWTAGAGAWNETELNARMDEMAASLSAFGGRNSAGLTMTCLRPFAEGMLDLFFAVLKEPHFEVTALQREIKSMQEQVKLRQDNPAQIAVLEFMKSMFGDHPYGRDPYGTVEGIGRLERGAVSDVFRKHSGLTVVASGAFDPKDLRAKLQSGLSDLKPGNGKSQTFPIHFPSQPMRVFHKSAKEQSHILYGFPGLTLTDPDRYALQVMQAILAGQGGRLFLELRDKASLAYSVSPMRMEGLEGGYFGAYIGCSPEKSATALKMMDIEFQKLIDTRVGDAELQRAQRYLIGKHDIELQKNSALTSSILFDHIYGIDYLETYKFTEHIRSVTAESIQKLARRIFVQPSVTSLVGPTAPW